MVQEIKENLKENGWFFITVDDYITKSEMLNHHVFDTYLRDMRRNTGELNDVIFIAIDEIPIRNSIELL